MKITHVVCQVLRVGSVAAKTASCQDAVLVRIRTDNGLEGIGEADSSPEVVKAIVDAPFSHNIACGLRELLVGENPLEIERLWQKMYRGTVYFGRTSVTITAMAAIDMALWDLKGKHFGEPIHKAARQDQGVCVDPLRQGRGCHHRHRCPLARSGLQGGEVRLGADGTVRKA
jgi:L-alanine-DL-glutamate epimerase-like enolase superfamily enzyme